MAVALRASFINVMFGFNRSGSMILLPDAERVSTALFSDANVRLPVRETEVIVDTGTRVPLEETGQLVASSVSLDRLSSALDDWIRSENERISQLRAALEKAEKRKD